MAFGLELGNAAPVYPRALGAGGVGSASTRQIPMQRHLAAFKAAHHVGAGTGTLSLVTPGGGLAHARAHTAADTLFAGVRLLGGAQIRKILCHIFLAQRRAGVPDSL